MMIKMSHAEIWYWYNIITKFHESGISAKEYCKKNNVNYTKFFNMRYRIEYKSITYPELYNKQLKLAKEYAASGKSITWFAIENGIELRTLTELNTHLNYLDIIEKIKQNPPTDTFIPDSNQSKEKPMKFVQVPSILTESKSVPIIEKIKQNNDVEIIISKGVKVIVSPEIGAQTLVKIIEFLKEL